MELLVPPDVRIRPFPEGAGMTLIMRRRILHF